jgi:hypothetical protein
VAETTDAVFAAGSAPTVAVLTYPIEECALEADITTGFLGFNPFVAQDFFPLGEKFTVKAGAINVIAIPPAFKRTSWLGFHTALEVLPHDLPSLE